MHVALFFIVFLFFSPWAMAETSGKISGNEFNPALSLILRAYYADIDNSEWELPGFQTGGEAGLPRQGFAMGHNELAASANIDNSFYGYITFAFIDAGEQTEFELENAWIETLNLGHGLSVRAGKFYSGIGYLNEVHDHAHDFVDRPLVYDALFGGHLRDTGVQVKWLAPTDFYLSVGSELTSGSAYPGGENENANSGRAVFLQTGGDISNSSNWQFGINYYAADFDVREAGAHQHTDASVLLDNELLQGDVEISGVDFVYKWAPDGNSTNRNLKLQAEYFVREESGLAEIFEGVDGAEADYQGKQKGFYVQSVYQFIKGWRVGARYDRLTADNAIQNFSNLGLGREEFLEESGIGTAGDPHRSSVMLDYLPSEFSRLRLQYGQFDNGREEDNDLLMLEYIVSLGAHGAHQY